MCLVDVFVKDCTCGSYAASAKIQCQCVQLGV